MAKAIHGITVSSDPIHKEVLAAARQYPELVAGEGRLTTRMMQGVSGLFMKDGAEAVCVLSLLDGRTLVFKIADGSMRSFGTIIQAALLEWGVKSPEESFNVYGGPNIVGGMRATL